MRRAPVTLSAVLAVLLFAGAWAQKGASPHCDPLVDVQGKGPGTYKDRGDRCEGEYAQKVAGGTGLRVASLTDTVPEFRFAPGDAVHLAWTTETDASVRLRAISLRSRHYYRMDSVRPAGSSTWVWPADVLQQHSLTSREMGVIGVTRRAFGDQERDIYVPVRMAKNAPPAPDKLYTLVVAPDATLQKLFLTIAPLNAAGGREAPILEDKDLQQGPYPGRLGIRVSLPPLPQRGYYSIELTGVTDNSKPVSVELTLYHGR